MFQDPIFKEWRPEKPRELPGIKEARKRVGILSNCKKLFLWDGELGQDQSQRLHFASWSYRECKTENRTCGPLPYLSSHDRNSTAFVSFIFPCEKSFTWSSMQLHTKIQPFIFHWKSRWPGVPRPHSYIETGQWNGPSFWLLETNSEASNGYPTSLPLQLVQLHLALLIFSLYACLRASHKPSKLWTRGTELAEGRARRLSCFLNIIDFLPWL